MNDRKRRIALPEWLDGRTVAMLSAFIALGALVQTSLMGLRDDMGAMEQRLRDDAEAMEQRLRDDLEATEQRLRDDMEATEQRLRDDMEVMEQHLRSDINDVRVADIDGRTGLRKEIGKLDDRLRNVEVGVAAIGAGMSGFDARLLVLEQHAAHAQP